MGDQDLFNSVLCCNLNILHLKGKRYAPAEIFLIRLAEKALFDPSPRGIDEAFRLLTKSNFYVSRVSRWVLHVCHNCGFEQSSGIYNAFTGQPNSEPKSWFFTHKEWSRDCHCEELCIRCENIPCTECNSICYCCEKDKPLIALMREQTPAAFFSNCITKEPRHFNLGGGRLEERCCAKYYKYFDFATKMFCEPICGECPDRIECLLIR